MTRNLCALLVLAACGGTRAVPPVDPAVAPEPSPQTATATPTPAPASDGLLARREQVRDTYHGVVVEDPYRWLEGRTAEVKAWTVAQTAHAEKVLGALPELAPLRQEFTTISKSSSTRYWIAASAAGRLFVYRKEPGMEQSQLVALADPSKPETATVVFDPNRTAGASIDWFVPSPDGSAVAIAVSIGGSEASDLHLVDLGGKELEPPIPNVSRPTALGSAAWTRDGKGIYYTRYPSVGEGHDTERDNWQQLWFHARGTPLSSDRVELDKQLGKVSQIRVTTNAKDRALAVIQNGDSGPVRIYVRGAGPKGTWRTLAEETDEVPTASLGARDDIWMISRKGSPRGKVLHARIDDAIGKATVVIPEGIDALAADFYEDWGVIDAGDRIYVSYQLGGPSELRAFTRDGKPAPKPALPAVSAVWKPVIRGGEAFVAVTSFTTPTSFYRVKRDGTAVRLDKLGLRSPVDLSGVEAIRETATSKDGTKVPYTVIQPKGASRDGTQRCLATGYGGYGISLGPGFLDYHAPYFARGVCLIVANLRGGGELGEDWHRAGMLVNKQTVFDDFIAVLADVATKKYSSPARLAMQGASNGGLLMGAVLTQRPELVKAAVIEVGILDAIRAELSPNGASNVPEFGTVTDEAQFKAMHAYSPLHHVTKRAYPATLLLTGENDGRVPPEHSRKMTAALQAAQQGPAPILLRTALGAGHGQGTSTTEAVEQSALVAAFVLWQLGS